PLATLSMTMDIATVPIVEHSLVAFDEERDFQWVVHADMLKSFEEEEWTFMPTKKNMKAMSALLKYNARADTGCRKSILKVRELKYVGARESSEYPTMYIHGDGAPLAFAHPYRDLPLIKSRVHPFLVVHKAINFVLRRTHPAVIRDLKPIYAAAARLQRQWSLMPPPEFNYGPDIHDEERHPASATNYATELRERQVPDGQTHQVANTSGGESHSKPTASSL
ncbi:hypothetical protein HDZ31DRAFT_4513, partial [Schizophyllum fasciatum]